MFAGLRNQIEACPGSLLLVFFGKAIYKQTNKQTKQAFLGRCPGQCLLGYVNWRHAFLQYQVFVLKFHLLLWITMGVCLTIVFVWGINFEYSWYGGLVWGAMAVGWGEPILGDLLKS